MSTFIENVLRDIKEKNLDFSNIIFILPSKRAGIFLNNKLKNYINKTSFAPQILSIEDFIQSVSKLNQISGVELLFYFYSVYKSITPINQIETFDSFSKWAQILIQDFNEIDRYLIPNHQIFDYISDIQELNHWALEEKKTELISNYLNFWKNLKVYYKTFSKQLIESNKAYQGLIYREAANKIEKYTSITNTNHIFLGFNALNTAEERIIKTILKNKAGNIYWDIDSTFLNNKIHSAGLFARQHKKKWSYYNNHPFTWITDSYKKKKNITIISCPKSVGQSKYVGNLLKKLSVSNSTFAKTAVVLGEESLLTPILNALPKSIDTVNITMGLPLKDVPIATLFEQIFTIHKLKSNLFYCKDVIAIISNQIIQTILSSSQNIIKVIQQNNIAYLSLDDIFELGETEDKTVLKLIFGDWHQRLDDNIQKCISIIHLAKNIFKNSETERRLELEYLYRFNILFNEINTLNSIYKYINDISTLHGIYRELLSTETLDFQGEPLEGLQIMGMLESRVLDFETVIITSVNEGILPGGKSNNSFIPFDVKIQNKLPTYKEKDAVYTYHFYSLIQRAKNVYLIYNTEVDALKGGEKSRFITQLEVENIHNISHKIISPSIPNINNSLTKIPKDDLVFAQIKKLAGKGFSPSSLTNYIRNPLDFYFDKILGVKDKETVEETVASNTLGTVIHNTLEDFYKPFEGKFLNVEDLKKMQLRIEKRIKFHFEKEYKKGQIDKGKNLIIFEIAKRYISNFLKSEIQLLTENNTLKILAIEVDNNIQINIPELNFPVKLKGKVDRVDKLNDVVRVIDYKSGKVDQNKVEIINWDDLNTDYDKYSKSFQVLSYAYMLTKQNIIQTPLEAGIISFKNLKSGFLKFAIKDSPHSRNKNHEITDQTLADFEIQLKKLILEICNQKIAFIEKDI